MRLTTGFLAVLLLPWAESLVGGEMMRGLFVFGHEVRSLQLCGDNRVFWLQAPAVVRRQLETEFHHLARRPYEAVYVEIQGEFSPQPARGFATDYDGTILVQDVRLVSREGIETCAAGQVAAVPGRAPDNHADTYVFFCEEKTAYTVRAAEDKAWVFHPQGTLLLPAMPASKGAKYSDRAYELWIDGQRAQLGDSGSKLECCLNDPRRAVWEKAKLDGADFRAVGNEPGWNLEIQGGNRLVLIADYGASRVELPLPEPGVDPKTRMTRWDAGELILEVVDRPCTDAMSGESFETTVVVTWGGRALRGCGRALH